MKVFRIRTLITMAATAIAITFILLTRLFSHEAEVLLAIEVILLPSVYIVGNYLLERKLTEYYRNEIERIARRAERLNAKYYKQREVISKLEGRLLQYEKQH